MQCLYREVPIGEESDSEPSSWREELSCVLLPPGRSGHRAQEEVETVGHQ